MLYSYINNIYKYVLHINCYDLIFISRESNSTREISTVTETTTATLTTTTTTPTTTSTTPTTTTTSPTTTMTNAIPEGMCILITLVIILHILHKCHTFSCYIAQAVTTMRKSSMVTMVLYQLTYYNTWII